MLALVRLGSLALVTLVRLGSLALVTLVRLPGLIRLSLCRLAFFLALLATFTLLRRKRTSFSWWFHHSHSIKVNTCIHVFIGQGIIDGPFAIIDEPQHLCVA